MFVNRAVPGAVNQQSAIVSGAPTPNYFWPMQEGSGTTTTDPITSTVATFSSATWGVGTGRNSTNCIVFASTQWVYVADPFYFDPISICFWAYPTVDAAYKVFLSKRNTTAGVSAGAEFEIYYDSARRLSARTWNGTERFFLQCSNDSIVLNSWNHVVVTTPGASGTVYGYVNAAQVGSVATVGVAENTTAAINFGGYTSNTTTRSYVGRMQEARFYNYQLSPSQVTEVYNAATP